MTCSVIARELLHPLDHLDDIFDRGLRHDAVSEVEDVAGTSGSGGQHLLHARLQNIVGSEQRDGIEVALNGAA